jgi:hypothetical protein
MLCLWCISDIKIRPSHEEEESGHLHERAVEFSGFSGFSGFEAHSKPEKQRLKVPGGAVIDLASQ